jgi:hypothetical protein
MSAEHVRKADGEIDPEHQIAFEVGDVGLVAEQSWVCDKRVGTKAIKLAIERALGTGPRTVTRMPLKLQKVRQNKIQAVQRADVATRLKVGKRTHAEAVNVRLTKIEEMLAKTLAQLEDREVIETKDIVTDY